MEPVTHSDEPLADRYRRYNTLCNSHDFGRLGDFVHDQVLVNGRSQDLAAYQDGLEQVIDAFPDYRWELQHLVVEAPWIAAHFQDTGTQQGTAFGIPASGRRVTTQEFAIYRFEAGRIAEVWVTADNLAVIDQLSD